MSKYPMVLFFRHDKYNEIDTILNNNKDSFNFSFEITSSTYHLQKLCNENYHILCTIGISDAEEYLYICKIIPHRFCGKWIHKSFENITFDFNELNYNFNYNYIHNVILPREKTRPDFSVFTTCFNSYNYILNAYNSLKQQSLIDWEWVILDDSTDSNHFEYLKKQLIHDYRVRLYNRSGNSGNIGNVKNEAVSLCRGKYLLELDHDDIIVPSCLQDAYNIFEENSSVGFVYGDTIPVYRNYSPYSYGKTIAKGYGSEYKFYDHVNKKWLNNYLTPCINNITLSHLCCCPNHPRMWRKTALMECENYSEYLPICDDYEIILRTCCKYDVVKINKPLYYQFSNDDGNNFSLIRNSEINRLGPNFIQPIFYNKYNVNDKMKQKNAFDEVDDINNIGIWKKINYQHHRLNKLINNDYNKQICIINENIFDNKLIDYYKENDCQLVFLTNIYNDYQVQLILSDLNYYNDIIFITLPDENENELINFFNILIKNDNCESEILNSNKTLVIDNNTTYHKSSLIINSIIEKYKYTSFCEIGVETGWCFNDIKLTDKLGIDPDPKFQNESITKMTSDDYFALNENRTFDIFFIDGMHQCEYVCRDFYNSLKKLNPNGSILIDDILPMNEREQLKFPINHVYENDILKYREPWTGDVWKFIYYLLKNVKMEFQWFQCKPHYRGIIYIKNIITDIPDDYEKIYEEINSYSYKDDFNKYVNYLFTCNLNVNNDSLDKLCNIYKNNKPYNHIVIDNFLHDNFAEYILNLINNKYANNHFLHCIENNTLNKACTFDFHTHQDCNSIINFFNGEYFIDKISKITGISNLIGDPIFKGGGFHLISNGGYLNLHKDFNYYKQFNIYRRVNVLIYFNKNWKKENQGCLELLDTETKEITDIEPLFNRAVILKVDEDDCIHGHTTPWITTETQENRMSLALYYYTKEKPDYIKNINNTVKWYN